MADHLASHTLTSTEKKKLKHIDPEMLGTGLAAQAAKEAEKLKKKKKELLDKAFQGQQGR